jgi:hypothetical protein
MFETVVMGRSHATVHGKKVQARVTQRAQERYLCRAQAELHCGSDRHRLPLTDSLGARRPWNHPGIRLQRESYG